MRKTYTKIILGGALFLWVLLGPISVVPTHFWVDPYNTNAQEATSPSEPMEVSWGYEIAHADETEATTSSTNVDLAVTLESILKVIYVLLWPALFIAGLAMDNSLVYWELFWLDDALYKFRSIMKNFANFALWFIFVRSIIQFVLNVQKGKWTHPKDLIVKLLLWSILVNTSWFIMWALVDLSTVLTVWIWWLPLQLIENENLSDKPIFGVKTNIKLNDAIWKNNSVAILHTWPGAVFPNNKPYLLPCYFDGGKIVRWEWRQTAFGVVDGNTTITGTNVTWASVVDNYCVSAWNLVNKELYEAQGSPSINNSEALSALYSGSLAKVRQDWVCSDNQACQTIKSVTKWTEWHQWAFYSLYASLLNLSTIHVWVPKSDTSIVMETLIKAIVALAYMIPLLILAITLIMRVWYLWIIIAFSPFIALASVDWLWSKIKDKMDNKVLKKAFDYKNVISLLLLPVVVTFAISLSIVFLSSLSEGISKSGTANSLWIYQRTEWNSTKCYDVWVTNICIDMPTRDIGTWIMDYFSWIIMNLFGIALMWFSVMAAMKSSEFTKDVVDKMQKLWEDMVMSAPIIPVPWGASTSLSALKQLPSQLEQKMDNSKAEWAAIFWESVEWLFKDTMGKDKKVKAAIWKTIDETEKIKDINEKKKNIVTAINSGAFSAPESMTFWQVDNSAAFANSLAEIAWDNTTKFTNWQDLFTTNTGQQILWKVLDGVKDKYGHEVDMGKLWAMYSWKRMANDWETRQKELEAFLPNTSKPDPTSAKTTYENPTSKKKYIIKDKKVFAVDATNKEVEITSTVSDLTQLQALKTDINAMVKENIEFDVTNTVFTIKWANNIETKYIFTFDPTKKEYNEKIQ